MVAFYVLGLPVPEGELNCSRGPNHKLYHANKDRLIPWRDAIAAAARQHAAQDKITGPVELELTFSVRRPKNHYGTGRNADKLKDSAPRLPITKPDLDHLERAIYDALTQAGVYDDDAQVTDSYVRKRYAGLYPNGTHEADVLEQPGVVVRIHPAGGDS